VNAGLVTQTALNFLLICHWCVLMLGKYVACDELGPILNSVTMVLKNRSKYVFTFTSPI